MYYIVYPFLYLFSLLPFFILYGISDFIAFLLHRVFKYRKEVIHGNLAIAFPEKTEAERERIAGQFYQYFSDTFIECVKCISISKKQLEKRNTSNYGLVNDLVDKGYNINILGGHQFNWEYGSLLYSQHFKIPMVAVYTPISNKIFSRIFLKFRTKYGAVFISAAEFKEKALAEGKPADMVDKIVEGQLNKYFAERCLLDQPFVKNPDQTVGEYVKENIAKLGENLVVRRFSRMAVGEVA